MRCYAWKRILVCLGVLTALSATSTTAFAQFAVTDPGNLIQNTTQVFQQIEQLQRQARQIEYQVKQVEYMAQNAKQLSASDYASLRRSFYQLQQTYRSAKYIGMSWGNVAQQYNTHYERFDPAVHDGKTYEEKREQWTRQTDDSIRTAMESHGVLEGYEGRVADLESLVSASNSAEGTLAAIQAGNQISALMLRQLMELTELIVLDSRARLSHMKEQQMNQNASRARGKDTLMRDYGKREAPAENTAKTLPKIR